MEASATVSKTIHGQTLTFKRPTSFAQIAKVRARFEFLKGNWHASEMWKRITDVLDNDARYRAKVEAAEDIDEDLQAEYAEIMEQFRQVGRVSEAEYQMHQEFRVCGFDDVAACLEDQAKRYLLFSEDSYQAMMELRYELFGLGRAGADEEASEVGGASGEGASVESVGHPSGSGQPATV